MKYKKIWKEEDRFVVSSDVFFYEVKTHVKGLPLRKLYPTFENRFWEVYALHRENGLYYAIIGKHHDVRMFYKNAIRFSKVGMFFFPMGRDLAVKSMDDVYWSVLSCQDRHLVNITEQFLIFPQLMITSVKYLSPVISMVQKSPQGGQVEIKSYWKQGEKGYIQLEEKEVRQTILNAFGLPEDPWFV